MARRLFFVPEFRRGAAELRGEAAHHLTHVLRVAPGQRYELSDNSSVWLAEVETARKELVSFRLIEAVERPQPRLKITLYAALIRFERMEWLIEKATELGADTIVPVATSRTEEGLEKAASKRVERWRKIAFEASQQSRRAQLAQVCEPVKLRQVLAVDPDVRLFADESGGVSLLSALPAEPAPGTSVAALIGPEGGWTEQERREAGESGWTAISLGPLILRAETAAIALLAVIGNAGR